MRRPYSCAWVIAAASGSAALAIAAYAASDPQQVLAGAPTDLAVTVYRAPFRNSGTISLRYLEGFALIRETRTVHLPAGLSRVRFEGVADGIEPVSAIVSGLTDAVIEKNLDAQLLSPSALIARAAGKPVTLVRTNAKTGEVESLAGTILTGGQADGVVFQTQEGIESLRCTGLAETFNFTDVTGLSASPTLSVAIRSARPVTQQVQLSYLTHGFDWAADYTAILSDDGTKIDLGAWVTLANGNGVGFATATTQVVAGRLNRNNGNVEPIDLGAPVLARCWPQGHTNDPAEVLQIERAYPLGFGPGSQLMQFARGISAAAPSAAMFNEVTVTGSRVKQEQLGDLKLYRVPQRTSVASRQSKQVRLLDRAAIPVHRLYTLQYRSGQDNTQWEPSTALLRTRNDEVNHLGLPLPSGRVSVFGIRDGSRLLLSQSDMRDLAINEEVEIGLGLATDVQGRIVTESTSVDASRTNTIPLIPGVVALREAVLEKAVRVDLSNARDVSVDFELMLYLNDRASLLRADHAISSKNGHPLIRLTVPANGKASIRFQAEHAAVRATRPR